MITIVRCEGYISFVNALMCCSQTNVAALPAHRSSVTVTRIKVFLAGLECLQNCLITTFLEPSFFQDLCHKISIPLYDILELNVSQMSVRVEPMVSVGQATAFLVPRGYTLAVCLEVAEATLGGLAMGVGMTTYSHKVTTFSLEV